MNNGEEFMVGLLGLTLLCLVAMDLGKAAIRDTGLNPPGYFEQLREPGFQSAALFDGR